MSDEVEQEQPVEVPEAPPEPPLNGLLVQRIDLDNGDYNLSLTLVGDCRKTEILQILRGALKQVEADLSA